MAYPPVPGPDGCGSIPGTGPAPETEQPLAWLTARTALAPGPQEALPSYGTESSRYRSSVQEPQSSLWNSLWTTLYRQLLVLHSTGPGP